MLAVEWGSGRRTGKLSNIHLGARDPATGSFMMLGKTSKGMTDETLAWQTNRFRYPVGWARVLRYRDDKGPVEVDTMDTVRSLCGC